ncbi:MAG: hypothetical protein ACK5MT_12810 [Actinomycetales bacterium]
MQQPTPELFIDLRALPAVVNLTRMISVADQFLVSSAQRNALSALRAQAAVRDDYASQADAWQPPSEY